MPTEIQFTIYRVQAKRVFAFDQQQESLLNLEQFSQRLKLFGRKGKT